MCSIGFEKVSHKDASIRVWKSSSGRLIGTCHLTWTVALLARALVPISFPFLARWKTIWGHLKPSTADNHQWTQTAWELQRAVGMLFGLLNNWKWNTCSRERLKNNKSSFSDKTKNEMIEASLHEMLPVYHKLLNSILNLGTMPQAWCGGLITPTYN